MSSNGWMTAFWFYWLCEPTSAIGANKSNNCLSPYPWWVVANILLASAYNLHNAISWRQKPGAQGYLFPKRRHGTMEKFFFVFFFVCCHRAACLGRQTSGKPKSHVPEIPWPTRGRIKRSRVSECSALIPSFPPTSALFGAKHSDLSSLYYSHPSSCSLSTSCYCECCRVIVLHRYLGGKGQFGLHY